MSGQSDQLQEARPHPGTLERATGCEAAAAPSYQQRLRRRVCAPR